MELLEILRRRRSVRQYVPGEIPAEALEKILQAGMLSPTGKGLRPWEFIVVRNPETLRALAALRRQEPSLQGSEVRFFPGPGRLVHYRRGGALDVFLNAGAAPCPLDAGRSPAFARGWDGRALAPGGVLIRPV